MKSNKPRGSDVLKVIRIGNEVYEILFTGTRKYGYIDYRDETMQLFLRNPTPRQREIMIMNLIREYSGREIKIREFCVLFAVSVRTIQKHINNLILKHLICRELIEADGKRHRGCRYFYVGGDNPITGKNYTYEEMLDPSNPLHIRDFWWEENSFIPYDFPDGKDPRMRGFYKEWISKYDLD